LDYFGAQEDFSMAEVRLQIPDETVTGLQEKLSINTKPTDIARDALTLYNWAVDERAKGRVLLTADAAGGNITRLAMPSLESVQKTTG
jgi:hypothetical protein